ncbi:MAG: TetR/AcrR family transcriptional regulator [Actinomycetota bacterium]|nr:TetR/AcrR family transcriptional regulator [Actinomycetota bacterium]
MTATDRPLLSPGRAAALPPEERRSTIVAATLPLLLEHGEAVTTRQIADAAGIAEGTIFRVFPDKDSVIRAVIDAVYDRNPLEEALSSIDVDRPLEQVLEDGVAMLQERVVSTFRVAAAVGPRFADTTRRGLVVSPWLVDVLTAHRKALTVKPAEAARVLHSLTLAITHPLLAAEPMTPRQIVQLFLHGVGASS